MSVTMTEETRKKEKATDAPTKSITMRPPQPTSGIIEQIARRERRSLGQVVLILAEEALIARGLLERPDEE